MNIPGVQRARNISKIGMHSSDTAELFFEDVRLPQSFRIGQEGMGFAYQMFQFVEERIFAGASGMMANVNYHCSKEMKASLNCRINIE